MPITAPPPAPSQLRPDDFDQEADDFLAWMEEFGTALVDEASLLLSGVSSTSTTSLTIGLGTQNLTVQTGKGYSAGMEVIIAYTTTPTTRMVGTVLSYDTGTGALSVSVSQTEGSGTQTAWTISPTTVSDYDGVVFTNLLLSGAITETPYALSGTDIDPANGTIQSKTLSGNWTATSSIADGQSVLLHITKGAYTITWPTMKWLYGAPTLSSSDTSVVIMWKVGSQLCGIYAGPLQ
jgi:hypothetical protein